jgi:hypothetical protein
MTNLWLYDVQIADYHQREARTDASPGHVNVLLCYAAHFAGATQKILRPPIRMTRHWKERPAVALDDDLVWLITQMRRLQTPLILNGEGWCDVI